MSQYKDLTVEIDGAVATIMFNRPQTLNALSDTMHEELLLALRDLSPGDSVRVIRIKGAGRAFCAGGDMGEIYDKFLAKPRAAGSAPAELGESRTAMDRQWLREIAERHLWMWWYRKPIVAQVHGYCLGAGIELSGACDIIFAAEDAKIGHPPSRAHGIPPTLGQWPFKIGMLKTKELMFTGDMINGLEAERMGMINYAVPADQLDQRTMAFCRRIANVPLEALTTVKHCTNRWFELAGLRTASLEGADFNALYHLTPAFTRFIEIAAQDGIAAALAWRDAPFKENAQPS